MRRSEYSNQRSAIGFQFGFCTNRGIVSASETLLQTPFCHMRGATAVVRVLK
jgi:hypothetical protein